MPSADGLCWAGFGHHLPERVVTNAEIEFDLGLAPGWILARTGISARHYASPGQALSDLAVPAGAMALENAGLAGREIGLLLLATSTPDHLLPPTAPLVAHRLGLSCGAVDIAGACSGFLHALALAAGHVRLTGQAVLVIAGNILSRRIDPKDASTRALFADAAGAVVVAPCADPGRGPLSVVLGSDGGQYGEILIERGGSRSPHVPGAPIEARMQMRDGRAVFAQAVECMATSSVEALRHAGLHPRDLGFWLPHQANGRILDQVAGRLGLGNTPRLGTLALHGNSSAATMPLALSWHHAEGGLLDSGPVLLSAFGAGTIWGAMAWQN